MSKELKEIVKKLQFEKDWTIEQVAESVGYSRVHLQREIKKSTKSELEAILISKHKDVLQNVTEKALPANGYTITLEDYIREIKAHNKFLQDLLISKVDKIDTNLSTTLGGVLQLSLHVESAREVALRSLARLEKKPQDALKNEADKIVLQLMKEHRKQDSFSGGGT